METNPNPKETLMGTTPSPRPNHVTDVMLPEEVERRNQAFALHAVVEAAAAERKATHVPDKVGTALPLAGE